jgi:transcription elongation factor GreA
MKDLNFLVEVERKRMTEEIMIHNQENTSLEENGGLQVAIEESDRIENRIRDINNMLADIVVVDTDENKSFSKVKFGSICKILDVDKDTEIVYKIVGPYEASPENLEISYLSPFGSFLLGKEKDEEYSFTNGSFDINIEILEIT